MRISHRKTKPKFWSIISDIVTIFSEKYEKSGINTLFLLQLFSHATSAPQMRVDALVSVVASSDSAHRGLYARVLSFDEHTVSGSQRQRHVNMITNNRTSSHNRVLSSAKAKISYIFSVVTKNMPENSVSQSPQNICL